MKKISLVVFDVDGVLLDSLAQHLKICQDKNVEYNLGLSIPTASEFKQLVRKGVRISPMKYFFSAVGFFDSYTEMALMDYKNNFMRDYPPCTFPGIEQMLLELANANTLMGVLTSNILANIGSALGDSMKYFRPDLILTKDNPVFESKCIALKLLASKVGVDINELIYVGDQPADFIAAKNAGSQFLGVTYGWGISQEDSEFPLANSTSEITRYILDN